MSCTESKAFTLGFYSSFSAPLRSHCLLACSEAPPPGHRPRLPRPRGWAWSSVSRSNEVSHESYLVNASFFHRTHPRGRSGLFGCSCVAVSGLAEPPTAHTDLRHSLSLWTERAWCWGQPGAANSLPWKAAKMPTPAATPGLTTTVCVSPCRPFLLRVAMAMATAGMPSPVSAGRAEVPRLQPRPPLRTIKQLVGSALPWQAQYSRAQHLLFSLSHFGGWTQTFLCLLFSL